MADAFISYSRQDATFTTALADGLRARGCSVWVDAHDLEDGEVFPAALRRAIEQADGFVFVVSPAGASSRFCRQEVSHAVALGKRIVPVLHHETPVDDLPDGIRERQWIPADADDLADRVARALAADPDHTREHTRLSLRAIDWETHGRRRSSLARGEELRDAETWLTGAQGRDPAPSGVQAAWIAASRSAASLRLRRLTGGAVLVALLTAGLLVFALANRRAVVAERAEARSRALAGASQDELDRSPQRALLLAREALRAGATPEAQLAATRALDTDTLRAVSAPAGAGDCEYSHRVVRLPDAPDRVAVSTCDGDVLVRAVDGGRVLRRVDLGEQVRDLAVRPDGSTLAAATDDGVVLLRPADLAGARRLARGLSVYGLAWSPSGRRLAFASEDRVGMLVPGSGRTSTALRVRPDETSVEGLAFAGEHRLLLAGQRYGGPSPLTGGGAVLDVRTGSIARLRLGTPAQIPFAETAVVSTDRRTWWFAGSRSEGGDTDDMRGRVWAVDAATGRVRTTHVAPTAAQASSMTRSPDGRALGVAYADGLAEVLDARSLRRTALHAGALAAGRGVAFLDSTDRLLVSGRDGVLRTWAPSSGEQLVRPVGPHWALAFSDDGREVVTSGRRSVAYDARTGGVLRHLPGWRPAGGFAAGAASADGRLYGWAGLADSPPLWHGVELATGRRLGSVPYASQTEPPGLTRDGRAVVFETGDDGTLRPGFAGLRGGPVRWLRPARIGRCAGAYPATSAGDRRLVAISECPTFAVWDARTGRVLRTFRLRERLLLQEASITPDGRAVVVATSGGGLVRATVADGRVLQRPALRPDVDTIELSPDGRWVVTGTASGVIDVFDARTLRLVRSHRLLAGAYDALAFSPDGRRLAVTDRDPRHRGPSTLHVWDVCDTCRSPGALRRRLDDRALRELTPDERRIFSVGD